MEFFFVFLLAYAPPAAAFFSPRTPLLGPSQTALAPAFHLQKLQTPQYTVVPGITLTPSASAVCLAMAKRDASRSGTKTDRLNRLAELDEDRVETDKGFVIKAAGGFVGLIVLLLVVAFASGAMDPLLMSM